MGFKRMVCSLAGLALAAMVLTPPLKAQDTAKFDEGQKDEIRAIIKDYLLSEPEVLREALVELNRRQEQVAEQERNKALSSLYKKETPFSVGDGEITIVEFFDYNCGYCRQAFDQIADFAEQEDDTRVVFIEFPILSEGSRVASQAAIASAEQDKYWEFHRALMQHNGPIQSDTVFKIAGDVGLDIDKLKADMEAPKVDQLIEENLQLGTAIGVQGTPAFFIGDQAIPGAPSELKAMLQEEVANIRENGCSVC